MYSREITKAFAKESAINFCYKYTDKQLETLEAVIACHIIINYKYVKFLRLFVLWNLRLGIIAL